MEILKVENLRKEYGEGNSKVVALDGVDLEIERGEFVAIVGPSGSGKSTLLHIIGGVDSPDDGKVYIDGNDISKYSSKELAYFRRRKVGLIYQFYNLIPNLTVRHNIELPLKLDKRKINQDEFSDIVKKLGIESKLDSFPSELSGGQQQRVAIARSLIYNPSII
ncbi:ABC transporter ATP-binding protein, partial [Peptoniphilus sp. BV3AC2]